MKTAIVALLVLLVVSQGEALRCRCGGLKFCSSSVETCYGSDNACASVIFYSGSRPSYFQGCMNLATCMGMNEQGISSAKCCWFDLCNR